MLVVPASSVLLSVVRRKSVVVRGLLVMGIVAYYVLGLGSPETNRDNPLYGEASAGLFETTHSEQAGLLYLRNLKNTNMSVDGYSCYYLRMYVPDGRLKCWIEEDLAQMQGLFTFRDVYQERRMLVGNLTSEDLAVLEESATMLLYDSGDFKVFDRVISQSYRTK
jgi:hypothetical protein